MTFCFDITDAEFSEYSKHFYKKRKTIKNWSYLILATALIAFNLYNRKTLNLNGETVFVTTTFELALISGLFGVVWLYFFHLFPRTKLKAEDKETLLGTWEITFADAQIMAKETYCDSIYRWEAIKKWEQTQHLYLLFLEQNAAILLPKRVFDNPDQQREFEQMLRRKLPNLTSDKYLDA